MTQQNTLSTFHVDPATLPVGYVMGDTDFSSFDAQSMSAADYLADTMAREDLGKPQTLNLCPNMTAASIFLHADLCDGFNFSAVDRLLHGYDRAPRHRMDLVTKAHDRDAGKLDLSSIYGDHAIVANRHDPARLTVLEGANQDDVVWTDSLPASVRALFEANSDRLVIHLDRAAHEVATRRSLRAIKRGIVRLHNLFAANACALGDVTDDANSRFAWAQVQVTAALHRLVVHDFLPKVLDPGVRRWIKRHGTPLTSQSDPNSTVLYLEFLLGAGMFADAMLENPIVSSDASMAGRAGSESRYGAASYQDAALDASGGPATMGAARRALRRGYMADLASSQDCHAILRWDHQIDIRPLNDAELGRGKRSWALRGGGLERNTPLWYYVVREAEVRHGGARLGPLGSHLVGQTYTAVIRQARLVGDLKAQGLGRGVTSFNDLVKLGSRPAT
ncbi:MAG: hypothetical protein AAGF71_12950 [Pseudomonadota bacterium]